MMHDFRHSGEQSAWDTLTQNTHFRFVVDAFHSIHTDLTTFAMLKGRNFLVTRQTAPRLYRLCRIAAERLDMKLEVPVYLQMGYGILAETVGTDDDCAIVMDSACVETCTEEQLLAIVGRELTHIRYGHVRMLNINKIADMLLTKIPGYGQASAQLFKTLLLQWRQYAAYTADRGAAIASQSGDAAMQTLTLALGRQLDGDGVDSTLQCVDENAGHDAEMSMAAKVVLQLMISKIKVPFGILRMKQLRQWYGSEECRAFFPGVYFGTASEFGLDRIEDGAALYQQFLVMQDHNPERAMAMLHAAAGRGVSQAQAHLGQLYLLGKSGLTKDLHKGLTLLRAAALAGNPSAWFGLGVCFHNGCSTLLPQNKDQADWMFRLAAAAGHPKAAERVVEPAALDRTPAGRAMTWFARSYEPGTCLIHEEDPWKGLDPEEMPADVRRFLWIPQNDPIYALEASQQEDGTLKRAIAVTRTGIYQYENQGIPFYMTWVQLRNWEVDGLRQGEQITLRINGQPFLSYRCDLKQRQIGQLILRIRTLLAS